LPLKQLHLTLVLLGRFKRTISALRSFDCPSKRNSDWMPRFVHDSLERKRGNVMGFIDDAPMFAYFPVSVGVANVRRFADRIATLSAFVPMICRFDTDLVPGDGRALPRRDAARGSSHASRSGFARQTLILANIAGARAGLAIVVLGLPRGVHSEDRPRRRRGAISPAARNKTASISAREVM